MTHDADPEDDAGALSHAEAAPLFSAFRDAETVLLAVSGGPDSVAMMGLCAAQVARGPFPRIVVATVDHGLRPGSGRAAEDVLALAAALGLRAIPLVWTGPKPAAGIQQAARAARYDLLVACARRIGATHLATAHTLDDQAETVMMRMSRGSGPRGLAAMRSRRELGGIVHVRPLLDVAKCRLVATCVARDWRFETDPSNADGRFGRTRMRDLMPRLAREGLDARRLATLARRIADADAVVEAAARRAADEASLADDGSRYATGRLLDDADAVLVRVLETVLARLAGATRVRLARVERLARDLRTAAENRRPLRRTLAGADVVFDGHDRLVLTPEHERVRGRSGALS